MVAKPKPRYRVQIPFTMGIWMDLKKPNGQFYEPQDAVDKAYAIGKARVMDIETGEIIWPTK